MQERSLLAPNALSGPGTSLENPFCVSSIPEGYFLLGRLFFNSNIGSCKVLNQRVTSVNVPSFPHPVDHYELFEADAGGQNSKGKLMDFYVYAYSDHPHSNTDLPFGLSSSDRSNEQKMNDLLGESMDKNPELKALLDKQALMMINIARLQKGQRLLTELPQKRGCLALISLLSLSAFAFMLFF